MQVKDVARQLQVCRGTVYKQIKLYSLTRGKDGLPARKEAGKYIVTRQSFSDFMNMNQL